MSAKKVLMLVGDFVEDYEAMVPYQMLLMVGHNVDVVSPSKKKGDFVKTAIHDFEGEQTYSEKRGHNFLITADFNKIHPEDYDALVIPGGRAPEHIRLDKKVIDIVKYFMKENKPVASICHGPQVLSAAGVLKDRTVCAYEAIKPEMELAGAIWKEPNLNATNAVTDGNLVTAPAWPAHPEWMAQFLKLLSTKIEA